jgi:cytochrome c-type biogenesis protein
MAVGGSTALIASPCSSPVLVSLLTFIATNVANPLQGALLLFCYSIGYVAPVVAAGAASGSVVNNLLFKQGSPWVNNVLGGLLLMYSSYAILENIPS